MSQATIEQHLSESQKMLAEMRKMNEETAKFVQEAHKARNEGDLAAKRVKWYEITILLAIVAATAAVTKIFL